MARATEFDLINAAGEFPIFEEDGDDLYYDMQEAAEQEMITARYARSRVPMGLFFAQERGSSDE